MVAFGELVNRVSPGAIRPVLVTDGKRNTIVYGMEKTTISVMLFLKSFKIFVYAIRPVRRVNALTPRVIA